MRYLILDIIRCVAILLLLISHIGQTINNPIMGAWFGINHFYKVSFGGLAVTIFLILSGLALQLNYGCKKIHLSKFIAKRCLKIYPIYYLSLMIGIPLFFLRWYYFDGYMAAGLGRLDLSDSILSITGFYAFVGKWGGPFVETSWFIALIMTMYILFPLLSHAIRKWPMIVILTLLLISIVSRIIIGSGGILTHFIRPLDWFPLCRIFEFSLGIYLALSIPEKIWHGWALLGRMIPPISFLSELSLPLFLIHQPLLPIIRYLVIHGISPLTASLFFVVVAFMTSWIALEIEKKNVSPFLDRKIRSWGVNLNVV